MTGTRVLSAALLLAATGAIADGPRRIPISTPTVISAPGSYYLTNDIYPDTTGTDTWTIRIDSGDVVLDLDGHTVWGNGLPGPGGTAVLCTPLTGRIRITNGSVHSPGGVRNIVVNAGEIRIDRLAAENFGTSNTELYAQRVVVQDSAFDGGDTNLRIAAAHAIVRRNDFRATDFGTIVASASGDLRIEDNVFSSGTASVSATRSLIRRNLFQSNYNGLQVGDNSAVEDNAFTDLQGYGPCGIVAGSNNRIRRNTTLRGLYSSGICIAGTANVLDGNISNENAKFGIEFYPGASGNLYLNNTALGNLLGGIEPGTGNIDGGGNVVP